MKHLGLGLGGLYTLMIAMILPSLALAQLRVKTQDGLLEGTLDQSTGIRMFKGIPYAAPPVGDLRWRAPRPVTPWAGVRKADKFGPRAMQLPLFGDMNFRSNGVSEDCLYLNVWTPKDAKVGSLPVLVYFYGGGFAAGDGSEYRYDGESMARRGIVAVTVNYRLGIFGFMAHPELTAGSAHHASGDYGLLDQVAALEWVKRNIAAFGGNPNHVTIGGESAGSMSVSALMASPLSKHLFQAAIGESGAIFSELSPVPRAQAEKQGLDIAAALGGDKPLTIAELRAMPAEELLQRAAKVGGLWFSVDVDGYFLPRTPKAIFEAGEQAHVPLLAGVNSQEMDYNAFLKGEKPTLENYRAALTRVFGDNADEAFKLYPAHDEEQVMDAAQDLAGDRFIRHATWTWTDLATKTGGEPTFFYLFARPRPAMRAEMGNAIAGLAGGVIRNPDPSKPRPPSARGAVHSAEIEYALGNLATNTVYDWTADDYAVSQAMQAYFANFIRTGNPNGPGLIDWPEFKTGERLVINVSCHPESVALQRERYDFLDRVGK
ncbi:fumonisin B1 esterase [mine drainage metagenome]|uniref:Fumonisin B1 esterase n=1 Tax=mine drainage metagenome TaxID=410659 RepID=A0A1J5TFR9_9ZZZZ